MGRKERKIRTDFRKNREVRTRDKDLTHRYDDDEDHDRLAATERISGKGALTRRRTIRADEIVEDDSGTVFLPEIDAEVCVKGCVLRVQGLVSHVLGSDNRLYHCATRRLLKSIATDQRHVVAAGDRVWIRPEGKDQGIIERVEPRYGVLSRTSRGRQHVIVANVDLIVIVASAAEPRLKPNLIDRYLMTAEQAEIAACICINKVDLINPADLQPLIGVYAQLGYRVLLLSATTGYNMRALKDLLRCRRSVLAGQSGVGKSSLLNAIDPSVGQRVEAVSRDSEKGRHTTTTAELFPIADDGYIVDTPGIRQFQLWDIIPEEMPGLFREIRPFVSMCRYPDCTHVHEDECGVKDAVADGLIDERRYESYVHVQRGEEP